MVYDKNQYIIRGDDPLLYVFFLELGLVKISLASVVHDECIIGYLTPGMNFAQTRSFFEADGGGLDYITTTPATVYRLSRERFLTQLSADTVFKDEYIQQLLRNQIYLLERLLYVGESSVHRRILRWLGMMAKYYGKPVERGIYIVPELTQTTIGNFLSVSRESVSQSLKVLKEKKLIAVVAKHITVLDAKALRAEL